MKLRSPFATAFFGVLSSPKDELSFTSDRLANGGVFQIALKNLLFVPIAASMAVATGSKAVLPFGEHRTPSHSLEVSREPSV